jgi:hypothetical protein
MVGFAGSAVIESIKRQLASGAKLLDLKSFCPWDDYIGVFTPRQPRAHSNQETVIYFVTVWPSSSVPSRQFFPAPLEQGSPQFQDIHQSHRSSLFGKDDSAGQLFHINILNKFKFASLFQQ